MHTVRLQSDILSQKQAKKRETKNTYHNVLAEDQSSVPSTHVGQLTAVSSHSFKLSGNHRLPTHMLFMARAHTHTHTHINISAKNNPIHMLFMTQTHIHKTAKNNL